MSELSTLPLSRFHEDMGANMVSFAGYSMPMTYTGIKQEHEGVRNNVGLFDVSHMGEIEIVGPEAILVADRLVTNDVSSLVDGQALYTVMCHENGGIVDDLLVYRLSATHVLLCVNAANRKKDWDHIQRHARGDAQLFEHSAEYVQLAVQGPNAVTLLAGITDGDVTNLGFFHSATMAISGHSCLVSRTGYTGEDGFELYIKLAEAEPIFKAVVAAGRELGMEMCGLGCRDTLRLEAKLHLYGQDITDDTNPLEAGLSWTVKFNKDADFVGKQALLDIKSIGLTRRLRGLIVQDKGIIRNGYDIYAGPTQVGKVTSGSYSITLGTSIGMGYIDLAHCKDETVDIAVRKNRLSAQLTTKPFYKNTSS